MSRSCSSRRGRRLDTSCPAAWRENESGQLVALDAATGKLLWHVNPGGNMSGAPMTYELDGRQYVLTPVGGWLYAWALLETAPRG